MAAPGEARADSISLPADFLRNSNTSGVADLSAGYGDAGDVPVVGDWNGDGVDTVGVSRGPTFFLRNSNTSGVADLSFVYGDPGDVPVVGDWNGDGVDTVGVYRGTTFYLRNSNTPGVADEVVTFGDIGDWPLVGDWNGDGIDTVGVSRGPTFFLRNSNTSGVADLSFVYGDPGDVPVVGDWNGDRTDTIGVQRLPALPASFDPYRGLGSWADVYDWSVAHGGNPPPFSLASVDHMAAEGVQTLYIQPVRWDDFANILEIDRVNAIIARAHIRGMRVVGWYLPDLRNVDTDLRHLIAIAQLPVDGLAVDIESPSIADPAARSQALVWMSDRLRASVPGRVLSAIVPSPTGMDLVSPGYWPGFPWTQLTRDYDLWQPMSYFTYRTGALRDTYTYFADNINRIRWHTGQPGAVVDPIGGIANGTSIDDVVGMLRACTERGCVGSSLYDYLTTNDSLWPVLRGFRFG